MLLIFCRRFIILLSVKIFQSHFDFSPNNEIIYAGNDLLEGIMGIEGITPIPHDTHNLLCNRAEYHHNVTSVLLH